MSNSYLTASHQREARVKALKSLENLRSMKDIRAEGVSCDDIDQAIALVETATPPIGFFKLQEPYWIDDCTLAVTIDMGNCDFTVTETYSFVGSVPSLGIKADPAQMSRDSQPATFKVMRMRFNFDQDMDVTGKEVVIKITGCFDTETVILTFPIPGERPSLDQPIFTKADLPIISDEMAEVLRHSAGAGEADMTLPDFSDRP
jgi:hypothetical protein